MSPDLILTISALITATGVIFGALYAIYKVARRIGDAIGVDSKGRTVSERLERVEHQLWENGGSSLADRVNIIEAHAIKSTAELELIKTLIVGDKETKPVAPKKTRLKKVS